MTRDGRLARLRFRMTRCTAAGASSKELCACSMILRPSSTFWIAFERHACEQLPHRSRMARSIASRVIDEPEGLTLSSKTRTIIFAYDGLDMAAG